MAERTPLLHYRLTTSSAPIPGNRTDEVGRQSANEASRSAAPKLGVIFEVVVPTLLSMFSVVAFLRIGFVVGQAGLYHSVTMFVVAYFIITMTLLSICAISTNGAFEAGGAYSMISGALCPEFGGSIGIMFFFFANICGCTLCVLGLVEVIMSTFGIPEAIAVFTGSHRLLPSGYWSCLCCCTILLFLCFVVFLFNGFTGIIAGSNMSGIVLFKRPDASSQKIVSQRPDFIYLLQRDYSFLEDINVWSPMVTVGIYSSAMSAAMSNLIGASRILYTLAKDNLLGGVLALARITSRSGNPWVSVLISWFLVQMVPFADKLNTIAGIVSILILLVYASVNLACLALEWASAPNFRYWHHLSVVSHGTPFIHTFISIGCMLLLWVLIHSLGPISNWGYISQALIFHQVRKYLLLLDVRKDHMKFWRPQVLMVANPRTCTSLMTLNDLKKSGLYVLGLGLLDGLPTDLLQSCYDSWLSLVDHLEIKAFVNPALADSVRHGVQNLLFISGFGGMRPNTLVLGFYDDCTPEDGLASQILPSVSSDSAADSEPQNPIFFPSVQRHEEPKHLQEEENVPIIAAAIKMGKNVALARYFNQFCREDVLGPQSSVGPFVDLWPLNLLHPDSHSYVNICSLFLIQLACVFHETRACKRAKIRLFLCVEAGCTLPEDEETKLQKMLKELRLSAQVHTVAWDQVVAMQRQGARAGGEGCSQKSKVRSRQEGEDQDGTQIAVNNLICQHGSSKPAVRFLYLPHPPADTSRYSAHLHQMDLSGNLGPALLIHGITPVITTDL
uniref:Amino acid permease/ SLC12A domain-containing protein n=1 Tax=Poecilia mexicana TaxID=48701 RepID=A0A3B3XI37_9TELE